VRNPTHELGSAIVSAASHTFEEKYISGWIRYHARSYDELRETILCAFRSVELHNRHGAQPAKTRNVDCFDRSLRLWQR
jgi:hypothetical protein